MWIHLLVFWNGNRLGHGFCSFRCFMRWVISLAMSSAENPACLTIFDMASEVGPSGREASTSANVQWPDGLCGNKAGRPLFVRKRFPQYGDRLVWNAFMRHGDVKEFEPARFRSISHGSGRRLILGFTIRAKIDESHDALVGRGACGYVSFAIER